ncbi:conserved hypothetical protein [Trichinella spiralis]|uniref:hypothetical protein n=1 Tax=Trichinella spiralis TaxID=6334 RepID=UPI0001EFBC4B|nr:conserved hypothetical protein [Trichinella spiralis]
MTNKLYYQLADYGSLLIFKTVGQYIIEFCRLPFGLIDMSIAENLAYQFAHGLLDFDRDIKGTGGSGKNRSKLEQFEHKRLNIESDTRRIFNQILQGISKQHVEHRPRRLRMNSKKSNTAIKIRLNSNRQKVVRNMPLQYAFTALLSLQLRFRKQNLRRMF